MNNNTTRSSIISRIEEMVKGVPGWTPIDQLYTLFNLVYTSNLHGDIIEVGSWCGRSTSVLGLAARLVEDTKVHCIDLFPGKNDWKQNKDGSYSFEVTINGQVFGGYKDQTVWKEPFERDIAPIYRTHSSVYEVFEQTIRKNDIADLTRVHKGTTRLFAQEDNQSLKSKLIFIDGDHSYDSVCEDIKNLEPFLVEGGWICFDDAFSCYQGVNNAIKDNIINNPAYENCQQMTRKLFVARKKYSFVSQHPKEDIIISAP